MPNRWWRSIEGAVNPKGGLRVIHLSLVGVMAALAIVLIAPPDTYGNSANWWIIAEHFTEAQAAFIFWGVATVGALGMATTKGWLCTAIILFLATAHGITAGLFLAASWAGAGPWLLIIFAAQGYYLAFRQIRDGKVF